MPWTVRIGGVQRECVDAGYDGAEGGGADAEEFARLQVKGEFQFDVADVDRAVAAPAGLVAGEGEGAGPVAVGEAQVVAVAAAEFFRE